MLRDLPMKFAAPPDNHYALHCAVYEAVLGRNGTGTRDFLFASLSEMGGVVLIRSDALPEPMAARALPVHIPETGETVAFHLVASPMRKSEGKTYPLPPGDAARLDWLVRQGLRNGFSVNDATVQCRRLSYRLPAKSGRRADTSFWLERADFTGCITVTDAERFSAAMRNGIGHARSLGHGLIRIWPIMNG